MSKKKRKNSDYRYLQRQYDERREEREKAERKKQKAQRKALIILAVIFIVGSLGLCIASYATNIAWFSPVYLSLSGLGMLMLYAYYKDDRPKYATAALVLGIIILVIAVLQMRDLGWLRYIGFDF